MVFNFNVLGWVQVNWVMYCWLVEGVFVYYQKDGEIWGDCVCLVDWVDVVCNDWLVVNQFNIQGLKLMCWLDVVFFFNGLLVIVLELKNLGDENVDIWVVFNQLQVYKEDILDLFISNELLVISDGIEVWVGLFIVDQEWFMVWCIIDGVMVDLLGGMCELEILVYGFFQCELLLDYLWYFILFEDEGKLVKKVVGYY